MITCIINGMAAYPAASQSIKITYANQYVTDDGEYSYDITFPMSIMNNRAYTRKDEPSANVQFTVVILFGIL